MEALGGETWFRLGDRDVALHVERTRRLKAGESLSAVTADLCRRMGVGPARRADDRRSGADPAADRPGLARFPGVFRASPLRAGGAANCSSRAPARRKPHPDFIAALADPSLEAVVICPSNPFISVEPILAIPGVREAMIGLPGADHRGFADHRRPGGEGADGQNDDGTGPGSHRPARSRNGMPICWMAM